MAFRNDYSKPFHQIQTEYNNQVQKQINFVGKKKKLTEQKKKLSDDIQALNDKKLSDEAKALQKKKLNDDIHALDEKISDLNKKISALDEIIDPLKIKLEAARKELHDKDVANLGKNAPKTKSPSFDLPRTKKNFDFK